MITGNYPDEVGMSSGSSDDEPADEASALTADLRQPTDGPTAPEEGEDTISPDGRTDEGLHSACGPAPVTHVVTENPDPCGPSLRSPVITQTEETGDSSASGCARPPAGAAQGEGHSDTAPRGTGLTPLQIEALLSFRRVWELARTAGGALDDLPSRVRLEGRRREEVATLTHHLLAMLGPISVGAVAANFDEGSQSPGFGSLHTISIVLGAVHPETL